MSDLYCSNDRPWHSDANSMARQIVAARGNLLPLEAALSQDIPGFFAAMIQRDTGHLSFQDYYESLGIIVGEAADQTGWYHCRLPVGWHISYADKPDFSREDIINFHDATGRQEFSILTPKDAGLRTARIFIPTRPYAK